MANALGFVIPKSICYMLYFAQTLPNSCPAARGAARRRGPYITSLRPVGCCLISQLIVSSCHIRLNSLYDVSLCDSRYSCRLFDYLDLAIIAPLPDVSDMGYLSLLILSTLLKFNYFDVSALSLIVTYTSLYASNSGIIGLKCLLSIDLYSLSTPKKGTRSNNQDNSAFALLFIKPLESLSGIIVSRQR